MYNRSDTIDNLVQLRDNYRMTFCCHFLYKYIRSQLRKNMDHTYNEGYIQQK